MDSASVLLATVAAPAVAFFTLGWMWLLGVDLKERGIARATCAAALFCTAGCAWLGWNLLVEQTPVAWTGGVWFRAGLYDFDLELIADRLSLPLMTLSSVLTGLVGAFSRRYLHKESGFLRFYLLLNLFAFGSLLTLAAGSFDLLIAGWELAGLSSALLVAFFYQRREPVKGSVYMYSMYRVGDLGLLLGVFVLHYLAGSAEDRHLFPGGWPLQQSNVGPAASLLTGFLFLFAAAAKSAQVPFSGWLPRAMEGPTPSSAIFYGAISVHLGAYLLLRIQPILASAPAVSTAVVVVGVASAMLGTLLHRAMPDAKTSVAYAAMTQLGLIFAEIGLGFPRIALLHIGGHAVARTLQFLRAPSILQDYRQVHAAAGGQLAPTGAHFEHVLPHGAQLWLYRCAVDHGFADVMVSRLAVRPMMALSRWLGSFEPASKSRTIAEASPALSLRSLLNNPELP